MLQKIAWVLFSSLIVVSGCSKSCSKPTEVKKDHPTVFFKSPENEAVLTSPVEIVFGVSGMKVRPALEDVNETTSGHHHLLIDHPVGYIEKGQPIPSDERHIHFGKGETSTSLILAPGIHTLTLQFANGAHLSYGKEMAQTIKVTVVEFSEEDMGPD